MLPISRDQRNGQEIGLRIGRRLLGDGQICRCTTRQLMLAPVLFDFLPMVLIQVDRVADLNTGVSLTPTDFAGESEKNSRVSLFCFLASSDTKLK